MSPQKKAVIVASLVASLLICVKFIIGILSSSVAVLASAIDSLLDLLTSLFNFFALSKSEKPADSHFNYGRGKIESLASVIEGSIIVVSGIFILYQSIMKLVRQEGIEYLEYSIYVMIFSVVVTLCLVLYLERIAKKSKNLIVKADALHYKTDLFSNGIVLISLAIVYFSGFNFVDGILGICIGVYIIYSAFSLIKEGVLVLLDRALNEELVCKIKQILEEEKGVIGYHDLKTRQSGEIYLVEVHLELDGEMNLSKAHKIADTLEKKIMNLEGKWEVITHLDPFGEEE
ncbi:cation diffusion facilitator family transporter [Helicobacter burdigaliensis]|uniref:cation diffusion facilitator family transporter n=1 Tax=Helicobacter burdigaliensis TaxID=2315334 RepID=UPI000EF642FD|nr:cation diffusion facilitator family transporter [Helicobacter burdigaliensis]